MIQITDLYKKHGDTVILNGIDFTVQTGDVAAVIGPSGGGKSTFLRCLNGLESFERGRVQIGNTELQAGVNSAATLQQVRRTVGFVFQQFNLFPHLTVLENLLLAPKVVLGDSGPEVQRRAMEWLDRVGLTQKKDSKPKDLSGGQQQRVAIARTLVMQPEVVLFDEPTSALDPVMAGEVLSVIADLARQQLTMVVVTHSMHFARSVADTVHVFSGGLEVESGPPSQVLGDPKHEVTKSFLLHAGEA